MLVKVRNLLRNKSLALIAVIFLIGAGAFALDYVGYLDWGRRDTVTVVGTSEGDVANQVASFTATVTASNPEKDAAVQEMNDRVNALLDAVRDFGIVSSNIKTLNFNVYQEQVWIQETQVSEFRDWKASTDIQVKLDDARQATDFSALLTSQDVSNVYGPNLMPQANSDETALLQSALRDAQMKASALASASGRRLGKVTHVSEVGSHAMPPVMYDRMVGMGGGGAANIEPGTSTASKTVVVTFKLR